MTLTRPTELEIRKHGGNLAVAIALTWLVGAIAFCLFVHGTLLLVIALFLPPIPIVYFIGQRLAVKAVTDNNIAAALRVALFRS